MSGKGFSMLELLFLHCRGPGSHILQVSEGPSWKAGGSWDAQGCSHASSSLGTHSWCSQTQPRPLLAHSPSALWALLGSGLPPLVALGQRSNKFSSAVSPQAASHARAPLPTITEMSPAMSPQHSTGTTAICQNIPLEPAVCWCQLVFACQLVGLSQAV